MIIETKRDRFEEFVIKNFQHIRPFTKKDFNTLEKYKDGSFGLSVIAFALYANGYNFRGKSSNYKMGLIYEDGDSIFSIGYFKKENALPSDNGYMFIISPRGSNVIPVIENLITKIHSSFNELEGTYIRFLNLDQYRQLLANKKFFPVKESPWHAEAPEEDETYTNSVVKIEELIVTPVVNDKIVVKNIKNLSKNSRKKMRYAFNRFNNFMNKNNLSFHLDVYEKISFRTIKSIIDDHFQMLKSLKKNIGSTAEDHYNSVDIDVLNHHSTDAFVGYLNRIPVSIFVGEYLSDTTFSIYTPFTIRDINLLPKKLISKIKDATGFTSISSFAYIKLFAELSKQKIQYVDLGGSEIQDLNKYKRQLGAQNTPNYWIYSPIKST